MSSFPSDLPLPSREVFVSQDVQTAHVAQSGRDWHFPTDRENDQIGRKADPFGAVSPPGDPAPVPPQVAIHEVVNRYPPNSDIALLAAELVRLSDIVTLQSAKEKDKARGKRPEGPPLLVPQVAIPSAEQVQARRKMGRPTVVTVELRHSIVTLLGAGASLSQTAAHVGVARNTIVAALERDEEFALEVHEARQRAAFIPLNCLLREAARNWRAAAWLLSYLERNGLQDRSRRERVLQSAADEIEADVVQELREKARRHRQAHKKAPNSHAVSSAEDCQPRLPRQRRSAIVGQGAASRDAGPSADTGQALPGEMVTPPSPSPPPD